MYELVGYVLAFILLERVAFFAQLVGVFVALQVVQAAW